MTTVAPTTEAPTTTVDALSEDAALIRRLVYEQQRFMLDLGAQSDWSEDDYIRYTSYLADRSEPTFRGANEAKCTNRAALDRDLFRSIPDSGKPYKFESWNLDLSTLQLDLDWAPDVDGEVIPLEGRTYIGTVEFQNFAGEVTTLDSHFNVQNGEAYWFYGVREFSSCIGS